MLFSLTFIIQTQTKTQNKNQNHRNKSVHLSYFRHNRIKNKEAAGDGDTQKKSTSPISRSIWNETVMSTTAATATLNHPLNDPGAENTNPNMICSDNERLLMLQRFASNNYCSSDESEDSLTTENNQK